MDILRLFGISLQEKKIISLVGGGGKTSTMYYLAREFKSRNLKVLVTTTTAIYCPDNSLYDHFFIWDTEKNPPIEMQSIEKGSITVIGSVITDENKLKGISKKWVDELYDCNIFDMILVEADGAKGRPIKAPDIHEPVIPDCTSILIGVIGLDCYGKRIELEWVHRPHILTEVVGRKLGDIIDDEVIANLTLSHDGLFKNCPEKCERILFINKVAENDYHIAQRIGDCILTRSEYVKKVVIGRKVAQ